MKITLVARRVLVSTATLAWGVNLPAHAVIIRGTDIYDAKRGQFVDVGILDVQQIFGRAGRPQFDVSGHGIIITTHDKMYHYVQMLMRQAPIESQFINRLDDNLNAEIVLGTVTNVHEAVRWLDFTYFMIRAKLNPLAYGIGWNVRQSDPELQQYRIELLERVAINLDRREMIRFNMSRGTFQSTDTGRLASHYYISANTIEMFLHGDEQCELKEHMTLAECLALVSHSSEFSQLKVREEEMEELEDIAARAMQPIKGGLANVQGKVRKCPCELNDIFFLQVNALMQAYIVGEFIENAALAIDMMYVEQVRAVFLKRFPIVMLCSIQNSARIARCLFEMAVRRCYTSAARGLLMLCKCIERRCWCVEGENCSHQ